jgi:DNA-binding transcriptional MerR regulator
MGRQREGRKGKARMVRKRSRWTRARDRGHHRPKTPAPKTGWLLAELAALTGLPVTTLRYYVQQGLLRPAEFRGTLTRYQRPELLRLLGIVRLKSEGKSTLAEKRSRLDSMSSGDLEKWLGSGPLAPAAAAALGLAAASPTPASNSATLAALPRTSIDLGRATNEVWQRIALLPGLELHVRADAPQAALAAAQRICDEYVVK